MPPSLPVISTEDELLGYLAQGANARVEVYRLGHFVVSLFSPRSPQPVVLASVEPGLAQRILHGETRLVEDGDFGLRFTLPAATPPGSRA